MLYFLCSKNDIPPLPIHSKLNPANVIRSLDFVLYNHVRNKHQSSVIKRGGCWKNLTNLNLQNKQK